MQILKILAIVGALIAAIVFFNILPVEKISQSFYSLMTANGSSAYADAQGGSEDMELFAAEQSSDEQTYHQVSDSSRWKKVAKASENEKSEDSRRWGQ